MTPRASVRAAIAVAALIGCGPALAKDATGGKEIYASICSSCHGIDGRAVLLYAPSFIRGDALDRDDATLIRSVRDGVFRMPPWGDVLSEREIAASIAYVRTLRKDREGAKPAPSPLKRK